VTIYPAALQIACKLFVRSRNFTNSAC